MRYFFNRNREISTRVANGSAYRLAARRVNEQAIRSRDEYLKSQGLPPAKDLPYVEIDPRLSRQIAYEFDRLPSGVPDPRTPAGRAALRSYMQFRKEIDQQFEHLPVRVDWWDRPGQPYQTSMEMMADVLDNKHLWVFTGGESHPILSRDELNRFRGVHDYYGHAAHGFQFGPRGEENAWLAHSQMFSPEAVPAMTAETRGQNSWVNYYGDHPLLPPPRRPYAEQKAYLLPERYWTHPALGNPSFEKPR